MGKHRNPQGRLSPPTFDIPAAVDLLREVIGRTDALVYATERHFDLSNDNLVAIEAAGAVPYIPFKSNNKGTGRTDAWRRLWHMFEAQNDQFLAHYHKHSNVERVFSAIKRKLGPSVRAKLLPAQINEVLLKCLAYT